jgi:hypothetical protein
LIFNIKLPEGFHLNPNAPQKYEISAENAKNVKIINPAQKFKTLPLTIPFQTVQKGAAKLKAKVTVYFCREDNTGVCMIKTLMWNVPLNVVADKKAATKVEIVTSVN